MGEGAVFYFGDNFFIPLYSGSSHVFLWLIITYQIRALQDRIASKAATLV